ncbi:MAG: TGS domain-containing protein, partial [bacterium]|nr:TGS domain-containing protein [bacterium]
SEDLEAASSEARRSAEVTHAHPEVADYPFTTRAPLPGMMNHKGVQIQLLDMPPISAEFTERWVPQVIRLANLSMLVVGLNDDSVLEEIDFIAETLEEHRLAVPDLLVANKSDSEGAADILEALKELCGTRFRYLPVSAATGEGLEVLAQTLYDDLKIVRMYSKPPGKPPDMSKPYVLTRGQTVIDAARLVHRDFAEHLKFTRLYHVNGEESGLMVDRHHVVEDEDILEFHV